MFMRALMFFVTVTSVVQWITNVVNVVETGPHQDNAEPYLDGEDEVTKKGERNTMLVTVVSVTETAVPRPLSSPPGATEDVTTVERLKNAIKVEKNRRTLDIGIGTTNTNEGTTTSVKTETPPPPPPPPETGNTVVQTKEKIKPREGKPPPPMSNHQFGTQLPPRCGVRDWDVSSSSMANKKGEGGGAGGDNHQNRTNNQPAARVAIVFYGLSRSLPHTLPSIQRHVFDVLDRANIAYDVFWSGTVNVTSDFSKSDFNELKDFFSGESPAPEWDLVKYEGDGVYKYLYKDKHGINRGGRPCCYNKSHRHQFPPLPIPIRKRSMTDVVVVEGPEERDSLALIRPCVVQLHDQRDMVLEHFPHFINSRRTLPSWLKGPDPWDDGFRSVRNLLCAFHTLHAAAAMVEKRALDNGHQYDAVVVARPDTGFVTDIDLPDKLLPILNQSTYDQTPPPPTVWVPNFLPAAVEGYNDRFAFGTTEAMLSTRYMRRGTRWRDNRNLKHLAPKNSPAFRRNGEAYLKFVLTEPPRETPAPPKYAYPPQRIKNSYPPVKNRKKASPGGGGGDGGSFGLMLAENMPPVPKNPPAPDGRPAVHFSSVRVVRVRSDGRIPLGEDEAPFEYKTRVERNVSQPYDIRQYPYPPHLIPPKIVLNEALRARCVNTSTREFFVNSC